MNRINDIINIIGTKLNKQIINFTLFQLNLFSVSNENIFIDT